MNGDREIVIEMAICFLPIRNHRTTTTFCCVSVYRIGALVDAVFSILLSVRTIILGSGVLTVRLRVQEQEGMLFLGGIARSIAWYL